MHPTADPMADVVVACPHCHQRCEVLAWTVGRPVRCPRCRRRFEAIAEQPKPPPKWTTCRSQRVNLGPPRFDDVRPPRGTRSKPRGTPPPPRPVEPEPFEEPEPQERVWQCVRCQRVGPPEFVSRITPATYVVFGIIAFMFPLLFLLACIYPVVPTEKFFGCPKCKTKIGMF